MGNIKTGQFIRDLRKEEGMTRRELADRLHITDRAVSKWERGLCAPEISLLEPLAETVAAGRSGRGPGITAWTAASGPCWS